MQRYDDLLIFVRVVERGSFVGAARQLGLPPTTVSRKVQELETRLGSQLLRPTTRRLAGHPVAIVANMLDRSHGPQAVPSTYSFEKDGKYEEVIFSPVMAVNDPDPLVAFALEGTGIAVVFEVMSREHIASGKLVNVLD